jgi:hypothetical protein
VSGKKHPRERGNRVLLCAGQRGSGVHALLAHVADALAACEAAGLVVKFSHGAVVTREGYVVPLGNGQWGARTLRYTEFSPVTDVEDD